MCDQRAAATPSGIVPYEGGRLTVQESMASRRHTLVTVPILRRSRHEPLKPEGLAHF
jgi:hypothetical protein